MTERAPDHRRSLAEDRDAVETYTDRLLATVRALDPGTQGAASLCPGWTRGHILSHVARNADALVNLVTAATTGERVPMYASPQARDADIEAGAARPLAEQIEDLDASAARWRAAAAALTDDLASRRVEARGGTMVRAGYLPFMRLREVVFHHVDLQAGFGWADVDQATLRALVADAVRRLRNHPDAPSLTIRTAEGDEWPVGSAAGAGSPVVSGSRAAVLAWLARGLTDGVEGDLPTLPFGG